MAAQLPCRLLVLILPAVLVTSLRGGPVLVADRTVPTPQPFLSGEVFDRLVKEEVEVINHGRRALLRPGVDWETVRWRMRHAAMLIAAAAQCHQGKYSLGKLATLRDSALALVRALTDNEERDIKKQADRLAAFPGLPVDPKARVVPVDLSSVFDLRDVMGIFNAADRGGRDLELKLADVPQYQERDARAQFTRESELDAYRIALVGRLMRGHKEATTRTEFARGELHSVDWDQWSAYMEKTAVDLARAVRARDDHTSRFRAGDLQATCVSCHRLHWSRADRILAANDWLFERLTVADRRMQREVARTLIRKAADSGAFDRVMLEASGRPYLAQVVAEYAARGDVAVLTGLLKVFKDPNSRARAQAAAALRATRLRALIQVPGVEQVLDEAPDRVCTWFARQLFHDPTEPVPLKECLYGALKARDEAVRIAAAKILIRLGGEPKAVLPAFDAALQVHNVAVRQEAARALRDLHSPLAIPMLIRALKDPDPLVRGRAGIALGRAGKAAVPALLGVLRGDNAEARASALYALGRIGPDARDAVPTLLCLLKDDDPYQRKLTGLALKHIDPKAAAREGIP